MTGLEDLFKGATDGRPDAFGGAQVFEAIVKRVDGKGVRVIVPGYDRQLLWGPCLPAGVRVELEDRVIIAMSDQGRPWIVAAPALPRVDDGD